MQANDAYDHPYADAWSRSWAEAALPRVVPPVRGWGHASAVSGGISRALHGDVWAGLAPPPPPLSSLPARSPTVVPDDVPAACPTEIPTAVDNAGSLRTTCTSSPTSSPTSNPPCVQTSTVACGGSPVGRWLCEDATADPTAFVLVRTLLGKTFGVQAARGRSVAALKAQIEERVDIAAADQVLIADGAQPGAGAWSGGERG